MSTWIHWKDKTILRCSNDIFDELYFRMLDLIHADEILLKELEPLIGNLGMCPYGWDLDLAGYIETNQDLLFFISLTRQALDIYKKECPEWLQSLDELDKELIEIGESFPNNVIVNDGKKTITIRSEGIVIRAACFELEKALKESDSILNENVTKAIEKLLGSSHFQAYFFGSIMAEYLHTKEEAIVFIDLVRRAVAICKQVTPDAQKIAQDFLEGFYQELVKISETFNPDQISNTQNLDEKELL